MEKILRKYYVSYNQETKKVIYISIAQGSELDLEIGLTQEEFEQIVENLDFTFVENGSLVVGESFKTTYTTKINNRNRIDELKGLLASTDWKVIVNSELIQVGLEPKYPNLHAERQAWRDEINQLEAFNESYDQ
jgi:hypothetical protein